MPVLCLKQAKAVSEPIVCARESWATAGTPYGAPGGPPQRYLVLSNGPEILSEKTFQPSGWANLYWGAIPFPGKKIRLRAYVDHLIDPKGTLDGIDIRLCVATRGGGGAKITRLVWTLANTPPDQPKQYVEAGRTVAYAHLAQKWQNAMQGPPIPVADESSAGEVAGVDMTLKRSPENQHYGDLVAELDIAAWRIRAAAS